MTVVRVTNEMQGSAILPGERSWILTRSVLTRDDKLGSKSLKTLEYESGLAYGGSD